MRHINEIERVNFAGTKYLARARARLFANSSFTSNQRSKHTPEIHTTSVRDVRHASTSGTRREWSWCAAAEGLPESASPAKHSCRGPSRCKTWGCGDVMLESCWAVRAREREQGSERARERERASAGEKERGWGKDEERSGTGSRLHREWSSWKRGSIVHTIVGNGGHETGVSTVSFPVVDGYTRMCVRHGRKRGEK